MRFRRRFILLVLAALLVFSGGGEVLALSQVTKEKPAKAGKKKTSPKKKKTAAKKPAAAPAEKPAAHSVYSLEGETFQRLRPGSRLSVGDADRYADIFAAQEKGDFRKANNLIARLDDHKLMGHVLKQRYAGRHYKSTYAELAAWMKNYADHAGAQEVYDLALKRRPQGAAGFLPPPQPGSGLRGYHDYDSGQLAQPYVADGEKSASGGSPQGAWAAGLSAWRARKYEEAAKHFERTAKSSRVSAWMSSAGAYWAARSHLRSRNPQRVSYWLLRAAEHPRSFYGIIAVKALGMEHTRFNWKLPDMDDALARAIMRIPAGDRALALRDARQFDPAKQELRHVDPGSDKALQQALLALAHEARAPDFEMRIGSALVDGDGVLYDAALYPDAPWIAEGDYTLDRALVHAFIRQESRFDAGAANKGSGATGLMQLLPSTAANVARNNGVKFSPERLADPPLNMRLGQAYLRELLEDGNVKNDLFKLAVAYNAGPGKLARWVKEVDYQEDPLLFIESIPSPETRVFVERVLTNYWIYRLKYNQNTDSLEGIASGEWPLYRSKD